jgi:Ser-tRNA(Ala) deacylase AlaX
MVQGFQIMQKSIDPRMHTAEHLLNQIMVRMFQCDRCFSAHIEKKKSKCDYHFKRALTHEETVEIERRVNEMIQADMQVTEEFLSKDEAQKHYTLERLPEGAGDRIRIVKVGDYDTCPCIGAHVRSTREIGAFRIISTGFDGGTLRIRYKLAG